MAYVLQRIMTDESEDASISRCVLRRGITTIGRAKDVGFQVRSVYAGRNHCAIILEEGKVWLTDLDSSNGTFVNCVSVKGAKFELQIGDIIGIGFRGTYDSYPSGELYPLFRLEKIPDEPTAIVDITHQDDDVEIVDVVINLDSDDEVDQLPEPELQKEDAAPTSPTPSTDEGEAIAIDSDDEDFQNDDSFTSQLLSRELKQEMEDLDDFMNSLQQTGNKRDSQTPIDFCLFTIDLEDPIEDSISTDANTDVSIKSEPNESLSFWNETMQPIEIVDSDDEEMILDGWKDLLSKNELKKEKPLSNRKCETMRNNETPAQNKSDSSEPTSKYTSLPQKIPCSIEIKRIGETVSIPTSPVVNQSMVQIGAKDITLPVAGTESSATETLNKKEKINDLKDRMKSCSVVLGPKVDEWFVFKNTTVLSQVESSGEHSSGSDEPIPRQKIILRRNSFRERSNEPIPTSSANVLENDQITNDDDRLSGSAPRRILQRRHSLASNLLIHDKSSVKKSSKVLHTVRKSDTPPLKRPDFKPISKRRNSIGVQLIDARPMPKRRQSTAVRDTSSDDKTLEKKLKHTQILVRNESFKSSAIGNLKRKREKEELQKCRKEKLKHIALVTKDSGDIVERIPTKPKVKLTVNNRGSFLTDDSFLPPLPSAVKKRTLQPPTPPVNQTKAPLIDLPSAIDSLVESSIQNTIKNNPTILTRLPTPSSPAFLEPERTLDFIRARSIIKKHSLTEPALNAIKEVTANTSKLFLLQKNVLTAKPSTEVCKLPSGSESVLSAGATSTLPLYGSESNENAAMDDASYGDFSQSRMLADEAREPQLSDYTIIMRGAPNSLKSILTKTNQRKPKRSITIDLGHNRIKEYFVDEGEDDREFRINQENEARKMLQKHKELRKSDFQNDPMHEIITSVTSWLPAWLLEKPDHRRLMLLNGTEPAPFLDSFESANNYLMNIIPIMKLELWQNIVNENKDLQARFTNPCDINMSVCFLETRGTSKRYIFHCQVNNTWSNEHINLHNLVLVSYGKDNPHRFFALITVCGNSTNNATPTKFFEMEAAAEVVNAYIPNNTSMIVRLVCRLKFDIRLFRAVFDLPKTPLVEHILNPRNVTFIEDETLANHYRYRGFDTLNRDQDQIVRSICCRVATGMPTITLVDGPPGTGKSRLITNLMLQLIYGHITERPIKIMVCTKTNSAADVICRKLIRILKSMTLNNSQPFSLVRYGLLDKIHPEVRPFSVSALSRKVHSMDDLQEERVKLKLKISARELKRKQFSESVTVDHELQQLENRLKILETAILQTKYNPNNPTRCFKYLLSRANIICTTLSSVVSLKEYLNAVDVCIVDEATTITETSTLILLSIGVPTLVLVGDTKQKPMAVQSQKALSLGLNRSLFDRLQHSFDSGKSNSLFRLTVQYRMDPEICCWPRNYYYDQKLASNTTMSHDTFPLKPYVVLNVEHRADAENGPIGHPPSFNVDETEFLARLMHVLSRTIQMNKHSIAVISPHKLRRDELMKKFSNPQFKHIQVDTVDAYQGCEKDIVVLSIFCPHYPGFLDSLSIAMTRAKKCLIVCGNYQSLKTHSTWHSLYADAKIRGHYHSFLYDENRVAFESQMSAVILKRSVSTNGVRYP